MTKLKFGAQLFTVRDHLQTEADFRSTMLALAEMGYTCVHTSGIGEAVSEDTIVAGVREAGLEVVLTHISPKRIKEETDAVIAFHNRLGCKVIGVGSIGMDPTYDNYMRFFDEMSGAIEKIRAAGMVFSYHNHHYEFARHEGRTMMDYILDATDPASVKLCFDAYWAHYAGMDETQFVLDHGDRILTTHTKDMVTIDHQPAMTEMLTGNINYDRFFATCADQGIRWHFVEQDICRMDSINSIRISRENLVARYGDDRD